MICWFELILFRRKFLNIRATVITKAKDPKLTQRKNFEVLCWLVSTSLAINFFPARKKLYRGNWQKKTHYRKSKENIFKGKNCWKSKSFVCTGVFFIFPYFPDQNYAIIFNVSLIFCFIIHIIVSSPPTCDLCFWHYHNNYVNMASVLCHVSSF